MAPRKRSKQHGNKKKPANERGSRNRGQTQISLFELEDRPQQPRGKTQPVPSAKKPQRRSPPSKAVVAPQAAEKPREPAPEEAPIKNPPNAAERMAADQREISVSEFFTKNRHLLGFDNPQKALLTAVKEAVDNSLDACEEAKILPEVEVVIQEITENRFRVRVTDNGPGVVKNQIAKIFGKLLYGSKFHRLKQSRGQQGIGISAAGMYGQLTTGKPLVVTSRTRDDRPAVRMELKIDTRKNEPQKLSEVEVSDGEFSRGTRVEFELEGIYRSGRRSVDQYIEQTAIANPHVTMRYRNPKGEEFIYARLTDVLPREAIAIKPHPHGVELGVLLNMLKDTRARDLKGMIAHDFCRVSDRMAAAICEDAKLPPTIKARHLGLEQAEKLHAAMGRAKVISPPTACVVPIGEELIHKGMEKGLRADFFTSVTRSPAVYRGYPFQVEVGLAWGGELPAEEQCTLYRFANRVPLQYQQSDCAITKAVVETDWRNYKVQQARGTLPTGPMVILVHLASVWVPFTSESKEAVARYPEILREIQLGLQVCGRRLAQHLSMRRREAEEGRKVSYIETYIPHIGIALQELLKLSEKQKERVITTLTETLRRSRTTAA